MTASDHLGKQFTEMYHGMLAKNVDSIRNDGLRPNEHVMMPARWPMLTAKRDEAENFAGKGGAVITYRVPNSTIDTDKNTSSEHRIYPPLGHLFALRKSLPGSMIHRVDVL